MDKIKTKIIFLGYNSKKTSLIKFLKKKKFKVISCNQKNIDDIKLNFSDTIISFGYKKILSKNLLKNLNFPPINLHMSYLPYNRGSHPNFWSFIDKTPKGVTIHEIDDKIDNGKIIFQKKFFFKINHKITFKYTYDYLFKELEKLFKKHYKKILSRRYIGKKKKIKGSIHFKADLKKKVVWTKPIKKYIKLYR